MASRPAVAWSPGAERGTANLASHLRALLSDMFGDGAAARAIGDAYLRRYPHEVNAAFLMEELLGRHRPADAAALARLIAERRVRDFKSGETVVLDGWVLARSEARFCALTVLL